MGAPVGYENAPVLVTGASGFIGTHLCRQLARLGAQVTGAYRSNPPTGDHAEWVRVDLTEPEAVRDLLNDIQPAFIFHLASDVQGRREPDAVLSTFNNNLAATVNLLLAAQGVASCKQMVISNSQEEPDRGDAHAVPASPYAASKFAASAYARMFHALYALPVVIARVFMVYGPEQKDPSKLVPYTILKALAGEAPELSSGQRRVDWIYVSDVVDGLLQLGCTPGLEGETVELGSGRCHTVREMVEEILRQIDPAIQGCFGAVADRPLEREPVADAAETKSKADWQAQVALPEGVAETIAWYRAQGGFPDA